MQIGKLNLVEAIVFFTGKNLTVCLSSKEAKKLTLEEGDEHITCKSTSAEIKTFFFVN